MYSKNTILLEKGRSNIMTGKAGARGSYFGSNDATIGLI